VRQHRVAVQQFHRDPSEEREVESSARPRKRHHISAQQARRDPSEDREAETSTRRYRDAAQEPKALPKPVRRKDPSLPGDENHGLRKKPRITRCVIKQYSVQRFIDSRAANECCSLFQVLATGSLSLMHLHSPRSLSLYLHSPRSLSPMQLSLHQLSLRSLSRFALLPVLSRFLSLITPDPQCYCTVSVFSTN
jgi:hypothetical protein